MADGPERRLSRVFSFSPFRSMPEKKVLLEGDSPVRIGGRALEILLLLVARPGELIGKHELLSRAWPGTLVEASNLKVNLASLRRALWDSPERRRYIATANGHGYRFVSSVDCGESASAPSAHTGTQADRHNLPLAVTRLIGRHETIQDVWLRSLDTQLLNIIGPGGIRKTRLALAVAGEAAATCEHGAGLVDLLPVTDPALVPGTFVRSVR